MSPADRTDPEIILLAGPTASGKSALALAFAEATGALVINADALQVYADWRVLTARPTAEEAARAPHRLYGHVDAARPDYSVGRWLDELSGALSEAREQGRPAVVVGGAGLYLGAAVEGLAPIPPIPPEIRAQAERTLRETGPPALLADLEAHDPETAARIDRANPRRIQRAWEVWAATGLGMTAWAARTPAPRIGAQARRFVIAPDRAALHAAIERRFHAMLAAGALEEVRAVRARGLSPDLPALQALGARPLSAHLAGERALGDAAEAAIIGTRQFAKRQETWFRNRFADWTRLDAAAALALRAEPRELLR